MKGRVAAEHLRGKCQTLCLALPRFLCLGEVGEVDVRASLEEPRDDRHAGRADEDLAHKVVEEQVPRLRLVHRRVRELLVERADRRLIFPQMGLFSFFPLS